MNDDKILENSSFCCYWERVIVEKSLETLYFHLKFSFYICTMKRKVLYGKKKKTITKELPNNKELKNDLNTGLY